MKIDEENYKKENSIEERPKNQDVEQLNDQILGSIFTISLYLVIRSSPRPSSYGKLFGQSFYQSTSSYRS